MVVPVALALPGFLLFALILFGGLRGNCTSADFSISALYVSTSVFLDMSISMTSKQHSGAPPYKKFAVVASVEVVKLVTSLLLLVRNKMVDKKPIVLPSAGDAVAVTVPASLYAMNNFLNMAALQKANIAAFAVLRETNLVFTALLWSFIFGASLGTTRWTYIVLIMLASTATEVEELQRSLDYAALLVLALTAVNACATVANEVFLKTRDHLDINVQNSLFYVLCGSFSVVSLVYQEGLSVLIPANFYDGWDEQVVSIMCGQCFIGLVVSRLLRNTSSVVKGVLTVFRPLCLLAASPLVTGEASYEVSKLAAGLVSGFAAYGYFREGKIEGGTTPAGLCRPAEKGKDASRGKWTYVAFFGVFLIFLQQAVATAARPASVVESLDLPPVGVR
jgi:hypothetical protein